MSWCYATSIDGAEDLGYLTGLVRSSGASVVTTLVANRNIIHMYAYRQLLSIRGTKGWSTP